MTMLIRSTTAAPLAVEGRTVLAFCVPFNKPAIVTSVGEDNIPAGQRYQEGFTQGAFQRAAKVPSRVTIRLSHSQDAIVRAGFGHKFLERADGLYGEFTADDTPVGNALLERAKDGEPLPLSVGHVPLRTERRNGVIWRTSVHLDHVAATGGTPVYKDARVLAVRAEELDDTRTLAYWLSRYGDLIRST